MTVAIDCVGGFLVELAVLIVEDGAVDLATRHQPPLGAQSARGRTHRPVAIFPLGAGACIALLVMCGLFVAIAVLGHIAVRLQAFDSPESPTNAAFHRTLVHNSIEI